MSESLPSRIAVVGTGTVGASWAAYFLSRGLEVSATDPGPGAEALLHRMIDQAWPVLEQLGLAEGADPGRLSFSDDLAVALDGAEFVQESSPEREDLKIELFAKLDGLTAPEVILASSTSGLLISRLQERCSHPERCVTGHPFNPPHLMPLVEVVGGAQTSAATVDRAMEFYRSIGKFPIHIRTEVVAHVANRLQAAVFREAIHLVASGVASAADVDAAVAYGPGLRWALMGPLLTFHLAGGEGGIEHFMDHLSEANNIWFADLSQDLITEESAAAVVRGVTEEAAGRSVAELAARRDAFLADLLELRKRRP
jgi:3-hydroxyacyl-CoA dehydrogenase